MTAHPLADVVSSQYERWMYPQPILDLRGWLANNWQWFDPSHASRMFWPDRDYKPGMDILVAGCGTNQAAVLAFTNPEAKVVAIDVSLRQSDPSVLMVKDALATLPQDHPVMSYVAVAPDLQFDAGLVDTFLHGRDRSYTIDDCLDLVGSAGLVFQDLFLKSAYYPPATSTSAFHATVAMMPAPRQWSIMERVNIRNGCHFFTACRGDRPKETYVIDFQSAGILDAVPSLRYRCGLSGNKLSRHNWTMTLDAVQVALAERVDGHRTIREIIAAASQRGPLPQGSQADLEQFATSLFQSLWQLDFLAMGLNERNSCVPFSS